MKREEIDDNNKHPEQTGTQPLAQNPNPRANENIRVRSEKTASENTGMEEEVGSEITDGEDA